MLREPRWTVKHGNFAVTLVTVYSFLKLSPSEVAIMRLHKSMIVFRFILSLALRSSGMPLSLLFTRQATAQQQNQQRPRRVTSNSAATQTNGNEEVDEGDV